MKLTVSYSEAASIILNHFNLSEQKDVELIIEAFDPTAPAFWAKLEGLDRTRLSDILNSVNHLGRIFDKIRAIKALRELSGLGLRESKNAIENWPAFVAAAARLNRWPKVLYRPAPAEGFNESPYFV